jgi:1-aminocyclopropane-1-carboxylate deaminase/D-cysteine desulfhydrase-like pyridoxal-dependent ACC family enzyme
MKDYIVTEIAKREAERQRITQRLDVLAAELKLLSDILARMDGDVVASMTPTHEASRRHRSSRLSARWAPVLRAAVERYPAALKNDDVPEIQRAAGQEPGDRNQIRSHVWTTAHAGLYEKLNAGSFRATQAAADSIGIPLGSAAEHALTTGQRGHEPNNDELFTKESSGGSTQRMSHGEPT